MSSTQGKPSEAVLTEIARIGLKAEEVAQYDLSKLSPARRVQSREFDGDARFAPKAEAERFAAMMAGGALYPHIIATEDEWLVDGNTRVQSRLDRKEKFHPALVLNTEWSSASNQTKENLFALAMTLNSMAGRAPSLAERKSAALRLIALDWTNEQIERALGIKRGNLPAMRRRYATMVRFQKLGIESNGILSGLHNALGNEKLALTLNDEPYRQLVMLAKDTGLKASEVNEFAVAAKETGSDEKALEYLAERRREMSDRIRTFGLTGTSKPPLARQLRQHLGFVNTHGGNPAALVETNLEYVERHREALTSAQAVLAAVLKEQAAITP